MTALSTFDGISCGRIAMDRAGLTPDVYYASEVNRHAIAISKKNYPDIVQMGDVTRLLDNYCMPWVDLFLGGSPCQGFSNAGDGLAFDDPRSKLFFDYVRILEHLRERNPDIKFLLENVPMKKQWQDIITKYLGVKPIEINSSLVSAQNRRRLYWTNIPGVLPPEDKKIYLRDIVLNCSIPVTYTAVRTEEAKLIRRIGFFEKKGDVSPKGEKYRDRVPRQDDKSNCIMPKDQEKQNLVLSAKALAYMDRLVKGGRNHWDFKHHSDILNDKSSAVVANFFKGVPYNVLKDLGCIRRFHPIECERLQTLPDNYTAGVSDSHRYQAIGNGWTVDIIAHILSYMKL